MRPGPAGGAVARPACEQPPDLVADLAVIDAHLSRGLVPSALDRIERCLGAFPGRGPLVRRKALALARLGRVREAQGLLAGLRARGDRHPETLGILARTYKDLWKGGPPGPRRRRLLRRCRDLYREGFRTDPHDEYTGINAASTSLLLGDVREARSLAAAVEALCRRRKPAAGDARYWREATLAEAHLVLGDFAAAARGYRRAAAAGRTAIANRASTASQARLLLGWYAGRRGADPAALAAVSSSVEFGTVVYCVGHMIDAPGRPEPRFPASRADAVRRRIRASLDEVGAAVGYCAAACGADILFGEELLRRGAEVHVQLPFRRSDYLETSVRFAGRGWVRRFHSLLRRATSVSEPVGEAYLGDDCLFELGNQTAVGRACLHAGALGVQPVFLAVWDRRSSRSRHGTAGTVRFLRRHGVGVIRVIDPGAGGGGAAPIGRDELRSAAVTASRPRRSGRLGRGVRAVLFADVAGFTRLDEQQRPAFMHDFLGAVSRLFGRGRYQPLTRNTWGDALYAVFGDILEAARFALDFRDLVRDEDWRARRLPREMHVRVALHAGPLFGARDPVTGMMTYYGAHAVRAARIEPITLAGSVFVTEVFAALLRARAPADLAVDYVGLQDLPKGYGEHPIYLLRRAGVPAAKVR